MPISPANFPNLQELSNGEDAISLVFNRPLFALSTRTNSLKTLLESVEDEVVTARDSFSTLDERLDSLFSSVFSDANMFFTGGSATWSSTGSSFTYSEITLVQPDKTFNYTIAAGSVASIADGDALYVTLSRNPAAPNLTLTKVAGGSVPSGPDIYVIAVRNGNRLWVRGSGEFEAEETREFGDGPTDALLGRLGMTHESDTDSHFTNTTIVNIADSIPTAISKLDLEAEYNIRDRNVIVHGGGNVSWVVSGGIGLLTLDEDLVVTVPSVGDVTIAAGIVNNISDDDVVYFDFVRTGSDYVKTLATIGKSSLPLIGQTNNFVLGHRSGTQFTWRMGDIFNSGETKPLGSGGAGLVVYQNQSMYPSSENDVTWDATAGQATTTGDIEIHFPWETFSNFIRSTEFPMNLSTDGKKAYVILDRTKQSDLTLIDDVDLVPVTYSQPDTLLVAERVNNSIYLFGAHRYNDGDTRRVGEGFVAGAIYDKSLVVTSSISIVTLPGGQTHGDDQKFLKLFGNGKLLHPTIDYDEGPTSTQVKARTGEMFPDGNFPTNMRLRFRIESVVTGGAGGGGGGGGGGTSWSDPVDANIVPDTNNTRYLGSTTNGFRGIFLADRIDGTVYELYIETGSLQIVQV